MLNRSMKGLAISMITIVTAQELRNSIQLDDADRWIDRATDDIRRDFVKPELQVVMENVARGWDETYGGMLYYRDRHGLPVQECWHDMKFWWPQNETIIATLFAAKLTGDSHDLRWHRMVHDWADQHVPDWEHGDCFGCLHRDRLLSVPLADDMCKSSFHLPRMQLVC